MYMTIIFIKISHIPARTSHEKRLVNKKTISVVCACHMPTYMACIILCDLSNNARVLFMDAYNISYINVRNNGSYGLRYYGAQTQM